MDDNIKKQKNAQLFMLKYTQNTQKSTSLMKKKMYIP